MWLQQESGPESRGFVSGYKTSHGALNLEGCIFSLHLLPNLIHHTGTFPCILSCPHSPLFHPVVQSTTEWLTASLPWVSAQPSSGIRPVLSPTNIHYGISVPVHANGKPVHRLRIWFSRWMEGIYQTWKNMLGTLPTVLGLLLMFVLLCSCYTRQLLQVPPDTMSSTSGVAHCPRLIEKHCHHLMQLLLMDKILILRFTACFSILRVMYETAFWVRPLIHLTRFCCHRLAAVFRVRNRIFFSLLPCKAFVPPVNYGPFPAFICKTHIKSWWKWQYPHSLIERKMFLASMMLGKINPSWHELKFIR